MNKKFVSFSLIICIFFLLFTSCFSMASAEDGWNFIKQNDNKSARKEFLNELGKDSINLNALKGMIYLSEIEQDNLAFKKYITTVINNYPDENIYMLFENAYEGKTQDVLKRKELSTRAKLPSMLNAAAELKEKRQFEQSEKAYSDLVANYNWSLIGPFKNICGSGYIVEHPIEKEPFQDSKIYKTETGLELKWVKPEYSSNTGKVNFDDYLPDTNGEGVYYANTFINVPEKASVQLRIARSAPMKLWLDDNLIFENNNKINFSWDNEIIEVELSAGIHRILVKNAGSGTKVKSYDFLNFFDNNTSLNNSDILNNIDFSNWSDLFNITGNNERIFALRLTDANGNILKKTTSAPSVSYTPHKYTVYKTDQMLINYFHQQVKDKPDDLFNYYALCKAHIRAGLSKQAEEFFVKTLRNNKESVLLKYLAAKLYAENGKIEKAYEVLNDIDYEKTSIFGLLYEKLKDIDINNEEIKYLEALNKLKSITPSNYSLIRDYLKYYDKKGMQKEKEAYIEEIKRTYPAYKNSLENELSLSDNKPYKDETDKEKKRNIKAAIKNLNTRFVTNDYTTAISYYKGKDRYTKVLALYNELISYMPYSVSFRKEKARYLYSEGKYEQAMKELNEVLKISPYDSRAMEQIGDIYYDMNKSNPINQKMALEYYSTAKKYNRNSSDIDNKIEKIEGQKTLKKLFTTKSFEDILKEDEWKRKYPKEESVVLMYTRDLVYDSLAHIEVYQQMMIKILTETGAKNWTEYDFGFLGNLKTLKVIKSNGAEFVPDKRDGYVVFKNLEPGDVIEIDGVYKWIQQSELDKEFALMNYISFDAPIYYKKFEMAVPKGMYLGYIYHKLEDKLVKSTKNDYDFYMWEYHELSKIEKEDAAPDNYDLYSSIMVSTMPDWSKIVNWYQQTAYRKLEISYEVKEVLDSIIKPGMSAEDKVVTIYNYLTKEIRYSYVPFLQSGYIPKDCGLTLSSKIGDCKDVATLMITMLRAVGIESYYTLVKTNSFNHQDMLPSLFFDHVLVYYITNDTSGFLDMTTDFYPHYVLTENDINARALIIKDGEKQIFRLPEDNLDPKKNKVEYEINATLNTEGSINLKVNAIHPGIAGGNIREVLSRVSELEQKNFIIDMLGKGVFQNLSLINHKFENLKEISNPLQSGYTLKASDFTDEVANLLICRIPYMTAIQPSPVISSKIRHNRLFLEALGKVEPTLQKVTIRFPEGYSLLQLPKDIAIKGKYGTYEVTFRNIDNGIYIEKYQSFSRTIIDEKEFQEFKNFYLKLLKLDQTKIAIQQNNLKNKQ